MDPVPQHVTVLEGAFCKVDGPLLEQQVQQLILAGRFKLLATSQGRCKIENAAHPTWPSRAKL